MDFALTTILLIFLLLPGLLFRRFYYTEEFSKEYFKESIASFFLSTAFPSTVLHIMCWQIVTQKYNLDINTFSILFSGSDDPTKIKIAFSNIYDHLREIICYFIMLAVISAIVGMLAKTVVRRTKLDRRVKLFRFQNEWHYLFSGEILDFPRVQGEASQIDFTFVDALVDTDEGTVIYKGVLQEYILSKDGGVDRIYLTDVKRRFLKDDDDPNRNYTLPGKFFIIPFSKILNLHLTYYAVENTKESLQELIQGGPSPAEDDSKKQPA
jgi:hypothetical protein